MFLGRRNDGILIRQMTRVAAAAGRSSKATRHAAMRAPTRQQEAQNARGRSREPTRGLGLSVVGGRGGRSSSSSSACGARRSSLHPRSTFHMTCHLRLIKKPSVFFRRHSSPERRRSTNSPVAKNVPSRRAGTPARFRSGTNRSLGGRTHVLFPAMGNEAVLLCFVFHPSELNSRCGGAVRTARRFARSVAPTQFH